MLAYGYSFLARVVGIMLFRESTYVEVEADTSANWQAILVVILVSGVTGVGIFLSEIGSVGIIGLILGTIFAAIGWLVWAGAILLLGTSYLGAPQTDGDWGGLPRALGFAQGPGLLRIFFFVPFLGKWFFLAVLIWQVATTVMAVRQSLDFTSTSSIVHVVILGCIPYGFLMTFLLFWIL